MNDNLTQRGKKMEFNNERVAKIIRGGSCTPASDIYNLPNLSKEEYAEATKYFLGRGCASLGVAARAETNAVTNAERFA